MLENKSLKNLKVRVSVKDKVQNIDEKVNIANYFLFVLIFVSLFLCYRMMKNYLDPVIMAIIIASLANPLYQWTEKKCKGRKSLAAFILCFFLVFVIMVPLLFIFSDVIKQGIASFHSINEWIAAGNLEKISTLPVVAKAVDFAEQYLPASLLQDDLLKEFDILSMIKEFSAKSGNFLMQQGGTLLGNITSVIINFFLMVFIFFFVVQNQKELFDFMKQTKTCLISFFFIVASFFVLTPLYASFLHQEYRVSGKTMGTFYHVTIVAKKGFDARGFKRKIDVQLKMINKSMSCFDKTSEISRFNRTGSNAAVKISQDFLNVMNKAQLLYKITNGAWDGTVKPFVDLWGFGTRDIVAEFPGKQEIKDLLAVTGFNKIEIMEHGLKKKAASLSLDLGSIAKGYGVDRVAYFLKKSGFNDFLVEIGGEIYASGTNKKSNQWSVGISRPEEEYAAQNIYKIISLKDRAIATSGNYRNFIKLKGEIYSHIIDPSTGYPVKNRVVSTSVIAEECTFADGLATALMVMDTKRGLDLINSLKNSECMIIVRDRDGKLHSLLSDNFSDYLFSGPR